MVWTSALRVASYVALASLLLLGLPLAAGAAQQSTEMHFETSIVSVYGSQYPLTGRLDLEIFPAGNIRGYYHTSYYKLNIPVVGGRDGNYIWLDIGPSSVDLGLGAGPQGRLHVVGAMGSDGAFHGQVYPETAAGLTGSISAQTLPNPVPTSNEQYLFSAVPAQPGNAPAADPPASDPP